jgi:nicotinamidase-related amidase
LTTAVLAIHFQNDVVHPAGRIRAGLAKDGPVRSTLLQNAQRLLLGARRAGVPVVSIAMVFPHDHDGVVQNSEMFRAAVRQRALVEGTWGVAFHGLLRPTADESVVRHSRINAFHNSDLEDVLRARGIRRLVVAGVATHSSVEHTARHAADAGYEVVVAADACAAGEAVLHQAALTTLDPHIDGILTVDEILATLGGARG